VLSKASQSTRATSEPPEAVGTQQQQQRVAEYEWAWGAFPLKTPGPQGGQHFPFPSGALSDDDDDTPTVATGLGSSADIAKKSRRGLVQLGSLTSSETGDFLLDMDGKKFEFELSLCGGPGWSEVRDEETRMKEFAANAVSYQRFLQDEGVVKSDRLVFRWNGRFVAFSYGCGGLTSFFPQVCIENRHNASICCPCWLARGWPWTSPDCDSGGRSPQIW
jgi:phosphatidate phosphatase LPIN